jgi:hypothetical protein
MAQLFPFARFSFPSLDRLGFAGRAKLLELNGQSLKTLPIFSFNLASQALFC